MVTQYCLLWSHLWWPQTWASSVCLPADAWTVWAAWAQAVLSVAAVIYSIRVSKRQHELDGVRQRNAHREEVISRVSGVTRFMADLLNALTKMRPWVVNGGTIDLELYKEISARAQVVGGYNLHGFEPLDARWVVQRLQGSVTSAVDACQQIYWQRTDATVSRQDLGALYTRWETQMSEAARELRQLESWIEKLRGELE